MDYTMSTRKRNNINFWLGMAYGGLWHWANPTLVPSPKNWHLPETTGERGSTHVWDGITNHNFQVKGKIHGKNVEQRAIPLPFIKSTFKKASIAYDCHWFIIIFPYFSIGSRIEKSLPSSPGRGVRRAAPAPGRSRERQSVLLVAHGQRGGQAAGASAPGHRTAGGSSWDQKEGNQGELKSSALSWDEISGMIYVKGSERSVLILGVWDWVDVWKLDRRG